MPEVRLYTDGFGLNYDWDTPNADVAQGALDWLDRAVLSRSEAEQYILDHAGLALEDLETEGEDALGESYA